HSIARIPHCNVHTQPSMLVHDRVSRNAVAMLAQTFGHHIFFLRLQHREPPNLVKISGETRFGSDDRQAGGLGHYSALLRLLPPRSAGRAPNRYIEPGGAGVFVSPPHFPLAPAGGGKGNCCNRERLQNEPYTDNAAKTARWRHFTVTGT